MKKNIYLFFKCPIHLQPLAIELLIKKAGFFVLKSEHNGVENFMKISPFENEAKAKDDLMKAVSTIKIEFKIRTA